MMEEQIKGIATICVAVAAMAGETALANGTGLPKPVDSRNPHADAALRAQPAVPPLTVTVRTANAMRAFRDIEVAGGPSVALLGVAACLHLPVPPDIRYRETCATEFIERVAAFSALQVYRTADGRNAVLYRPLPEQETESALAGLSAREETTRLDAIRRVMRNPDIRTIPLLAELAANEEEPRTALAATAALRRMGWKAVAMIVPGSADRAARDIFHPDRDVSDSAIEALGVLGNEHAWTLLERPLALIASRSMEADPGSIPRSTPDARVRRIRVDFGADARARAATQDPVFGTIPRTILVPCRKAVEILGCFGEDERAIAVGALAALHPYTERPFMVALPRMEGDRADALLRANLTNHNLSHAALGPAVRRLGEQDVFEALRSLYETAKPQGREWPMERIAHMGGSLAEAYLKNIVAEQFGNLSVRTISAVGASGSASLTAILKERFPDASSPARHAILRALVTAGDNEARAFLEQAFDNPQFQDQSMVVREISHVGGDWALPLLQAALASPEVRFRRVAASVLPWAAGDRGRTTSLIEKALKDSAAPVRTEAAGAMAGWEDDRLDRLIEQAMADSDFRVREAAVAALPLLRGARQWETMLAKALNDPNDRVKAAAIALAIAYGGISELGPLFADDPLTESRMVRRSLVQGAVAARDIGFIGNEQALGLLGQALAENNPFDSRDAALALGCIGGEQAVALLGRALNASARHPVRMAAIESLGRIGGEQAIARLGAALAKAISEGHSAATAATWREPMLHRRAVVVALCLAEGKGRDELLGVAAAGDDPFSQRLAAYFLAREMGEGPAKAWIEGMTADRTEQVLQSMGGRAQSVALAKVHYSALPPAVAVEHAAGAVASSDEQARSAAIEFLKAACANTDADIRLSAVEALAKSRDKTVANHLVGLLNDPDRRVRRAASIAIRELQKN